MAPSKVCVQTKPANDAKPSNAAQADALRNLADLSGLRGWPVFGKLLLIERDRLHQNVEG